jgi:hypothetical protein
MNSTSSYGVIEAIGDGNCFYHSLLTSVSNTYRDESKVIEYARESERVPSLNEARGVYARLFKRSIFDFLFSRSSYSEGEAIKYLYEQHGILSSFIKAYVGDVSKPYVKVNDYLYSPGSYALDLIVKGDTDNVCFNSYEEEIVGGSRNLIETFKDLSISSFKGRDDFQEMYGKLLREENLPESSGLDDWYTTGMNFIQIVNSFKIKSLDLNYRSSWISGYFSYNTSGVERLKRDDVTELMLDPERSVNLLTGRAFTQDEVESLFKRDPRTILNERGTLIPLKDMRSPINLNYWVNSGGYTIYNSVTMKSLDEFTKSMLSDEWACDSDIIPIIPDILGLTILIVRGDELYTRYSPLSGDRDTKLYVVLQSTGNHFNSISEDVEETLESIISTRRVTLFERDHVLVKHLLDL